MRSIYGCTADEKVKRLEDEIFETKKNLRVWINRQNYHARIDPGIDTNVEISKDVEKSSKIFLQSFNDLNFEISSHLVVDNLILDEVKCLLENDSSN